jgi:hypothetical protein
LQQWLLQQGGGVMWHMCLQEGTSHLQSFRDLSPQQLHLAWIKRLTASQLNSGSSVKTMCGLLMERWISLQSVSIDALATGTKGLASRSLGALGVGEKSAWF